MGHAADGGLRMEHSYEVFSPTGQPLMEAPEHCRYPRRIEKDMLEAGYTIRLHGRKITKAELKKEGGRYEQAAVLHRPASRR